MVNSGKNMSSLKENNRNTIISYIYNYGPSSRKTIADFIGITQAAVGKICKDLINMNILCELGARDSASAGRREVILDINYRKFYCIGINLFRENIVILLTYINGEKIKQIEVKYDENTDLMDQIKESINSLLNNLELDKSSIMGIGVSSRGKTDSNRGVVILENGVILPIKEELEKEIGIKTYVDNNVRNIMIQEISMVNLAKDTMFIKWGPGLGSSVYINQHIVYGSTLKAGEIGKISITESNGKTSTLEEIFREDKIVSDVISNFNKNTMPMLSKIVDQKEDISIDSIIEILNSEKNDYVKNIVIEKVEILLDKLSVIDSLLDINNIILYGRIFEQDNFFREIENIVNTKFKTLEGKIKKSQLKQKNEYYSPIYLVISNIFN